MEVYRLSRLRNRAVPKGCLGPGGEVIPDRILTKAPTAELKPNQKDQDTLPPYEVLDDILECLVERDMPVKDIAARGHPARNRPPDRAHAQHRRVQAPPGRARRQDLGKEFRPGQALSHHQQIP